MLDEQRENEDYKERKKALATKKIKIKESRNKKFNETNKDAKKLDNDMGEQAN